MQGLTDKEFDLIREYTKNHYGINLTIEKKSLVYSRLKSVIDKKGFNNFTEYYQYLTEDKTGVEAVTFIDKITTNHTFFMRETDHFDYLYNNVFPFIEDTVKDKDIRTWCAGCSSGEESYYIEILLDMYFKNKGNWNTELLATDISTLVLEKAIKGVYTKQQIKLLPDNFKSNYFEEINSNQVRVIENIRKKLTYRKFNLMEPKFPFKKKFHVIFCRNVMIYFDDLTKEQLVNKFYDLSEKGAYLFIGHSETLNNIKTEYEYIMPAIYRKT